MSGSAAHFAAAVLAGGRSIRMGEDKAALRLPDGRTLLARQLDLLNGIEPAEVFVSARRAQLLPSLPPHVCRIDDEGAAGPLGGIVACLRATDAPRLLVIAVDLPQLETATLRTLLSLPGGVVPRTAHGLEPLAAVYPRAFVPLAEEAIARGEFRLRYLLKSIPAAVLFSVIPVGDERPFLNWNRPADRPPA